MGYFRHHNALAFQPPFRKELLVWTLWTPSLSCSQNILYDTKKCPYKRHQVIFAAIIFSIHSLVSRGRCLNARICNEMLWAKIKILLRKWAILASFRCLCPSQTVVKFYNKQVSKELWLCWWSGCFHHKRSALWILSMANFFRIFLFIVLKVQR